MKVMNHLRLPPKIGVKDVLAQLQCQRHGVAIVIVCDIMAPIKQRGILLVWVRKVPSIVVHHSVSSINLDDRRNKCYQVVSNRLDIWALVDRQPIGQFH